jgi:plastocyanin
MTKARMVFAAAAAGTALLLAVAACGGDDGDDEAAAEATTAAATTEAAPAETAAETGQSGGTLVGTVGPGFTITLTQEGQPVTSLAPGTYTVEIDDEASSHNFHLTGPGVDEATDVGETGKTTWMVTLEAGDYQYVCDPHASSMNGSFTVG